jgi:cytochrome c peroxidase
MTRNVWMAGLLGIGAAVWVGTTVVVAKPGQAPGTMANPVTFQDASGSFQTYDVNGSIDLGNPFFQSLGTNGRACVTCHEPSDAWTVTPDHIQARFKASQGLDPIFRTNDGSVSPDADVSSVAARRAAYRMLLTKGLIRVGIAMQDSFEFELIGVDDPYGHASAADLSLFRRPLPAANLGFLSTVMWDGRETFAGRSMDFDLSDQANGATLGHAQGATPLTDAQRQQVVDFETGLFTAQSADNDAGPLDIRGAMGGPAALSQQSFFIGINDVLSASFTPQAFTLFDGWQNLRGPASVIASSAKAPLVGIRDHGPVISASDAQFDNARRSIARGQAIFNSRPITITGVNGLNDVLGKPTITGTCTTCHDAPNAGDHSVSLPLDIGIASEDRRTPDLPLYTFRNKTTGETVTTTDPGRALITGKWQDMSKFKGPILRGLGARPPYFHNGSAATLDDVVDFYNTRFGLNLSPREKADLIAFLKAL